ncbi:MAG TPA: hypothetical protein VFS31_15705, partial [Chitinophagaceae bacterium]|nr:hypothetical protein [Chitinophagaceae bacterium]
MKKISLFLLAFLPLSLFAQNVMTPELLWSLGRVSAVSMSPDGKTLLYKVAKTDIATEKNNSEYFLLNLGNNQVMKTDMLDGRSFVQWDRNGLYASKDNELYKSTDNGSSWKVVSAQLKDAENIRVSPDGKWIAFSRPVPVEKILGTDRYNDVKNSTAQVYTDLNFRHWDAWNEGKVSHLFLITADNARG